MVDLADNRKHSTVVELPDGSKKSIKATNLEVAFAKELAKQEISGKYHSKGKPLNKAKALQMAKGCKPSNAVKTKAAEMAKRENVIALKDNMVREFQYALMAECDVQDFAKEVVSSYKTEEGSKKVPGLTLFADIMRVRAGASPSSDSAAKHIHNSINYYINGQD